jgi:hypothetical protein
LKAYQIQSQIRILDVKLTTKPDPKKLLWRHNTPADKRPLLGQSCVQVKDNDKRQLLIKKIINT